MRSLSRILPAVLLSCLCGRLQRLYFFAFTFLIFEYGP